MQCPGCQHENPSGQAEKAHVLNEARAIFSEAMELYRQMRRQFYLKQAEDELRVIH